MSNSLLYAPSHEFRRYEGAETGSDRLRRIRATDGFGIGRERCSRLQWPRRLRCADRGVEHGDDGLACSKLTRHDSEPRVADLGSLCNLSNGDSWINCRNLGLWRNPARDGPAGQGFRHGSPRDVARARETTARRIPCAGHQRYGRRVAGQAVHRGPELKFLAGLDFLILALPLTKRTHGLIGERQLQALPRTSFVLNPARGPIIQEHVLVKALQEGWIAGAALDTHYHYPMPADHPLWQFPNVVLHAAYFRILIEPTLSGAYLGNFSE